MLPNTIIFTLVFDINDYQPIEQLATICEHMIPDKIKVCHLVKDLSIAQETVPFEGHLLTQLESVVKLHFEDHRFYDLDYEVITPNVFSQIFQQYIQFKQVMLLLGMQPTTVLQQQNQWLLSLINNSTF